jgi:RES domain-containing protein
LTTVYRLLRKPFAATPFDGEGSYRYGGRWSAPGTRIAYIAEHLSFAMLEYLVHLDPNQAPRDLMLARPGFQMICLRCDSAQTNYRADGKTIRLRSP